MTDYTQVCVWHDCILGDSTPEEFEKYFLDKMGVKVKFLEEIITKPDLNDSNSGGRHDLLFSISNEDIPKFSVSRFGMSDPPRWLEDVLDNEESKTPNYSIYPEHIKEYYSWKRDNKEIDSDE